MKIEIRSTNVPLSHEEMELLRQRVARTLDRFAGEVASLDVVVTDENAAKGGVDKRVVATLRPRSGETISVESRSARVESAVLTASRRARQILVRQRRRQRQASRRTLPAVT